MAAMVSVWAALVSAISALAGVVLGQWLQVRRDAAQYVRDLEREARQVKREDKTRFAEERRRAYAECLRHVDQAERILARFDEAKERGSVPAGLRAGPPFAEWVTHELEAEYETLYQQIGEHHAYFELMAPEAVVGAAFAAQEAWDVVGRNALLERSYDLAFLRGARTALVSSMKVDLDSPVSDQASA